MTPMRLPARMLAGLLVVCTSGLLACTSGGGQGAPADLNAAKPHPAQPVSTPSLHGPGVNLPSPSQLAERLFKPTKAKSASYVAADLLKQAESFDTTLSHQLVTATASGASFTPDWEAGTGTYAGLSFALYSFTIPNYDGNPALYYNWITPPADPVSVHIALANWGKDRWDWYVGSDTGRLDLPSLSPYFAFGGGLVVCVLRTGTDASELDWLRVGSVPPVASLTESRRFGLAPFTVDFDASGSTDSDGTIAEFKWDPEGDGTFDQSSGTDPTFSYEFTTTGDFKPAVRVIDSDGVHDDLAVDETAVDSANFSYGAPSYGEQPHAIVACGDGHLLIVGERSQGDIQALITKVSPAGTADFTKAWGGTKSDRLMDAVLADDSYVYACGNTSSYGQGQSDALLQKWTQDGQLVWSRTIGSVDGSESFNALLIHGDSIYACGSFYLNITFHTYGFIARLDREGNVTWSHTLIGPEDARFNDVAFYTPVTIDTPSVRVCGNYYQTSSDIDALYASYDEDGNQLACKTWGTASSSDTGVALALVGFIANPATYVAGSTSAGTQSRTFLGRPGGTTVEISSGSNERLVPYAMLSLNVLMRRYVSGSGYSMVLGTFNNSLSLVAQTEIGAVPDGSNTPAAMINYGGTGLVLTGYQSGQLPSPSAISLDVQTSATPWVDISPPQGSPSQLVVQDTPTDMTDLSGFAFNRAGTDPDTFVYTSHF